LDIPTLTFWLITSAAAILGIGSYVYLRRAKREYDKASGVVEDLIFSFNRQLKQEAMRVETTAYKVEATSSRVDETVNEVNELRNAVGNMKENMLADSKIRDSLLVRLIDLERRTGETTASHNSLLSKVTALEAQARQQSPVPDTGLEAALPIKREKALAHLTDTEVSVMEFLISGGPKTAPEIKERVQLSREHTARLMKELYEEGYLERDTGKIPFRYTVKKEMEKFLRKAENEPA
jgi:hypothetical protein